MPLISKAGLLSLFFLSPAVLAVGALARVVQSTSKKEISQHFNIS